MVQVCQELKTHIGALLKTFKKQSEVYLKEKTIYTKIKAMSLAVENRRNKAFDTDVE